MWQINGMQASLSLTLSFLLSLPLSLPLSLSLSSAHPTHRVAKLNVILRKREWKQATENRNKW